jgi:hypothetical protein
MSDSCVIRLRIVSRSSVFKARGGKIEYTAGKLTVKATSLLQLKGRINYKP